MIPVLPQREAVAQFAKHQNYTIADEYVEVESGNDALERRPKLAAAIKHARRVKGPVIVAKLDRLSRDVNFISGLMTHKVPFVTVELGSGYRPVPIASVRGLSRARAADHRRAHQGRIAGSQGSWREAGWHQCPIDRQSR